VQQAIWLDCDNQSEIFLAKNLDYHSKTKNIDVQYHFMRVMIEDKKVLLVKVDTLKNFVDSLTKYVCWLWSLIIFFIQRSCFSRVWNPLPDVGVWGGLDPHISR
jgi:hypothetical protein